MGNLAEARFDQGAQAIGLCKLMLPPLVPLVAARAVASTVSLLPLLLLLIGRSHYAHYRTVEPGRCRCVLPAARYGGYLRIACSLLGLPYLLRREIRRCSKSYRNCGNEALSQQPITVPDEIGFTLLLRAHKLSLAGCTGIRRELEHK